MKKLKIYKSFLLIFCLAMIISFNLTPVFATEPNLNQPSDPSSEVSQKSPENQSNEQNKQAVNKQSTYKKSTSVKNNNPSQQSNVSNVNNSSQNMQQSSNENQNSINAEQSQQNTEKNEESKKEKKEKSKSTGEFLTTYPEKFNWEKIKEIEKSDENAENTEDKDNKPKDLPEVKDEEIILPEVMAVTETKNESSVSLFAGVVAWSCILAGIAIILFVLFMNKNGGEFPVDSEKAKKKRKSSTAKKYYKGNF